MKKMGWMERLPALVAGCLVLAACTEIPQDAPKPYAGKEDTKAYAGDRWKGDKEKFDKALAERARFQDDYDHARAERWEAETSQPAARKP